MSPSGGSQQVVNSLNNDFVDHGVLALHAMLLATAVRPPVGGPALLLFVMILLAARNATTQNAPSTAVMNGQTGIFTANPKFGCLRS